MHALNDYSDEQQAATMSVGMLSAIALHMLALLWFSSDYIVTKLNPQEMFSPPTQVNIRFLSPKQATPEPAPAKPVIEKVQKPKPIAKKPVVKKQRVKPVAVKKATPKATPTPVAAPAIVKKSAPKPPKPTTIPVVSEAAAFLNRVDPKYPKRAERMGHEGEVSLRVLISEVGKQIEIKTLKPAPYATLNRAALKALKKSTFKPYIMNGKPVKSQVEITYAFVAK